MTVKMVPLQDLEEVLNKCKKMDLKYVDVIVDVSNPEQHTFAITYQPDYFNPNIDAIIDDTKF